MTTNPPNPEFAQHANPQRRPRRRPRSNRPARTATGPSPVRTELPDAEAKELSRLLQTFLSAPDLPRQVDALEELAGWTREGTGDRTAEGSQTLSPAALRRTLALVEWIERAPQIRSRVQAAMGRMLEATDSVGLFSEAGIPRDQGFVSELIRLLTRKILPVPRNDSHLASILGRVFGTEAAAFRIRRISPDLFHRYIRAFAPQPRSRAYRSLGAGFAGGFRVLASRVQAHGLEAKLRDRSSPVPVGRSPFHLLARLSYRLIDSWESGSVSEGMVTEWRALAAECQSELRTIHARMESEGVDVGIVFSVEVIERSLVRMDTMIGLIATPSKEERSALLQRLVSRLLVDVARDRTIGHLVRWSLHLLDRKIIERSGHTGEHYIAMTRKEYRLIWAAAAGGGLVTVFTAAGKLGIAGGFLPLFQEGFLVGLNYAVSFLILQAFGLLLATKQPAMTAATLARSAAAPSDESTLDQMVEFTKRIVSSQLAAAAANIIVVFAGAVIFNIVWQLVAGHPFLSLEKAQYVYHSLSPVDSGTVFYAALTGVVLWLASIVGGWFDNLTAYNRVPQGIAEHPIGKLLGRERLARWGGATAHEAAGWGTNVSLGFMLGFVPAIGAFLGVPLDVRHVTLSTGTLSLAIGALGPEWLLQGWFFRAIGGIATMFVLNLSVSFGLSLYNAMSALGYPPRFLLTYLKRIVREFFVHPLQFVLPPARSSHVARAASHSHNGSTRS
jgi:site-specific recombinase